MVRKRVVLLLGLALALIASGCSHVLSSAVLAEADPTLSLEEVRGKPDLYRGKTLVLGGMIVDHEVTREGSVLEVVSYVVNRWGEPVRLDEMGGRFLVKTERFLDPGVFVAGQYLTLSVTLIGQELRPLKGRDYPYPVFTPLELHLWSNRTPDYGPPWYNDPFAPPWPYGRIYGPPYPPRPIYPYYR